MEPLNLSYEFHLNNTSKNHLKPHISIQNMNINIRAIYNVFILIFVNVYNFNS